MSGRPDKHAAVDIQHRRQLVAALYVKGWRQAAIGEHLGMCQSDVSNDLKEIRLEWREARLASMDEWIDAQLAKIDKMECEAWDQWEKSKGDRKKTTKKEFENANGGGLEKSLTIEDGLGDPRYLGIVDKAIERRCKILGLEKAPQDNKGSELTADKIAAIRMLRQDLLSNDGFQGSGNLAADSQPDGLGANG